MLQYTADEYALTKFQMNSDIAKLGLLCVIFCDIS